MPPRTPTLTRLLETPPAVPAPAPAPAPANALADMDRDGEEVDVADAGRKAEEDDDVRALLADIDRNEGVDAILAVRTMPRMPGLGTMC